MKISIIIPVYNVSNYIIKCIDSLVNQTYKNLEIIIVDDSSPDDSIDKIKEKYDDKRIKIYHKENGGVASARNFGVSVSTGEYLFFVDSDDFIDLHTIEKLYNEATFGNYDLVLCDYYKYFSDNNYKEMPLICHYDSNNLKSIATAMPGPVCKLIKRELYLDNNIFFPENYCFEDCAIMPILNALAKNPSYINESLYYYVQREGSSMNKNEYDKRWEDIFFVLDYLKKKFHEHDLFDEYYSELEYIYIDHLMHAANLRFLESKKAHKNIKKVSNIMKKEWPGWKKNKYYKCENIKYKIICNLFYYNLIHVIRLIRRTK